MDFLDVGRSVHLKYGCALIGVGFNCDHEPQELASTDPKNAFFRVEVHAVFTDFSEYFFQVCHVLGYAMRFDNHFINDISSNLLFEDSIHQLIVCSTCIFQAKGHDPVAKVDISSDECRFLFIWGMYPNLMMPKNQELSKFQRIRSQKASRIKFQRIKIQE